jgi:hypothetical protein
MIDNNSLNATRNTLRLIINGRKDEIFQDKYPFLAYFLPKGKM